MQVPDLASTQRPPCYPFPVNFRVTVLFLAGSIALAACTKKVETRQTNVVFGKSQCHYCKMLITVKGFGGMLETTSGEHQHYGASECMAAQLISERTKPEEVKRLWTIDHRAPTTLIETKHAHFLRSKKTRSPMGLNIAGYRSPEAMQKAKQEFNGETYDWEGVVTLVKKTWFKSKFPELLK